MVRTQFNGPWEKLNVDPQIQLEFGCKYFNTNFSIINVGLTIKFYSLMALTYLSNI